jgi:hypothetical protein
MEKLKQDYESKLALALQNFQTCEDEKQQIKEDYERRITLEIQEKKAIQVQVCFLALNLIDSFIV